MLGEGSDDGGDAEADVFGGADSKDGGGDDGSAEEGAEGRVGDVALEDASDGVGGACEEHGGEAEGDARGDGGEQVDGVERGLERLWRDGVEGVVDVPGAGDVVGCEGGEEAGEDGLVADGADGEDLQSEDGSGKGCAKDGAEACADTGHEEDFAVGVGEGEPREASEQDGDLVGEGGPGLECGAFASCRATEEMGDAGAEQDERGHAEGDGGGRGFDLGVNLFEDEIVTCLDGTSEGVVEDADEQAGEGQECDDPAVRFAGVRGPVEHDEQDG